MIFPREKEINFPPNVGKKIRKGKNVRNFTETRTLLTISKTTIFYHCQYITLACTVEQHAFTTHHWHAGVRVLNRAYC